MRCMALGRFLEDADILSSVPARLHFLAFFRHQSALLGQLGDELPRGNKQLMLVPPHIFVLTVGNGFLSKRSDHHLSI